MKKDKSNLQEYLAKNTDGKFIQINRLHVQLMLATGDNLWGCYCFMSLIAGKERICKFSQAGLAKRLNISERTIKRIFKQLQELKLIEGVKSDTSAIHYKILSVNDENIKEILKSGGDNNVTIERCQTCPKDGDNVVQKEVSNLSKKKSEKSLQQVEKKSEIDTAHQGLLDPILLDHSLLHLRKDNIRKDNISCEASASELSSTSLADAFLIFEDQIENLISQPLSRLFQEPFTNDLSNEELIRYRNTLPESLPILKSTINAYSIFALHEYFFKCECYSKSDRAECLQAIEDFAALMLQRHKVRLTDKLFCRAIMLLTPGEFIEYGQNYWSNFVFRGHLFKIYDQKLGIYKKFYAAITSDRTCNISNKIIHEKIS